MRAGGSTVADLGLDDLEMQAFRSSRSPWLTRSLMAVGALAAVFAIYQGTGGSVDEEAAQPGGVSVRTASAAVAPAVEEEPSAWEKEQAMLKEADRLDDAATKAQAAAFGASLAGESKEKKAPAAAAKRKWRPKAKKAAVSKSAANTEYDPMNGSL